MREDSEIMDQPILTRPKNALNDKNLGFVKKLSFSWIYPLLELGSKMPLSEIHLPEVHKLESSAFQRKHIENIWKKEIETKRKNLARALFVEYLTSTWRVHLLALVNMISRIGQALALGMLMEQFGKFDSDPGNEEQIIIDTKKGYFYAGLLVLTGLIAFPTKQHQFFHAYRKGLQMRVGLISAIYNKAMRLPAAGIYGNNHASAGHVTNLASNDVERFVNTCVTASFLIVGPFISIVILIIGIFIIGPVFAAGYGLLFLLVPLQMYFGRQFAVLRSKVAKITDSRMNLISQAVNGARVVKFNGWENNFEQKINCIRKGEVVQLQKASFFRAMNEALFYFTSLAVSVFIFALHVMLGGSLSPKNVFTIMTLFNIVQFILTKHLPNSVMGLCECYISCQRIQAFLDLPELEHIAEEVDVNEKKKDLGNSSQTLLSFTNVTCHWKKDLNSDVKMNGGDSQIEPEKLALSDISISFQKGKLYCIIGAVGQGKTALLQALSGELPVSTGEVKRMYKSFSYAVQDPWIMDASVRENIVMGCPFDEKWYNQVIECCNLEEDIKNFVLGDDTTLGDRGVQISGGQQARIGLARAIYVRSDILLLDDCLSAVDSKVARTLFYSAIQKLVLSRGCCVVLVTHQLQFAGEADHCMYIDNGKILAEGSFEHCVSVSNGKLANTLQTKEGTTTKNSSTVKSENVTSLFHEQKIKAVSSNTTRQKNEDSMQKEKRTTGVIELATWKAYGDAFGGSFICFIFFVLFSATQVLQLLVIVEIGHWSAASKDLQSSFIVFVSWLTFGVIILSISRASLTFYFLIKASQHLHQHMLHSVLRAKIEFFDTNPLGRILNRFSSDVGISDEILPLTLYDFLAGLFIVVGSIGTAIVSLPFILIVFPPLLYYFIRLRGIFLKTTRELKRLEGMARSPVFSLMSEVLKGITTIRSNDKIQYFSEKFESAQNAHSRAFFAFTAASRWFAYQLDLISFFIMAVATVFAVLFHDQGWFDVDPAVLGLSLTLLIQISTTNFPWIVRQSAEVSNQMVSVERIVEYADISSEAPLKKDIDKDLEDWLGNNTSIVISDLSIRYRSNLPVCLDGISVHIESGERIGVVGRTGSGKSSLVQSLFRLLEAETGTIEIDGIDISSIGLHKLRTSMAVIPQFPVLFSGCTIRENLDPFSRYTDEEIRDALEAVQMIKTIEALPEKLSSGVVEGGANFSVGQRQLLCLARAILVQNRIIVLDEPTANVDSNTDRLLQQTLREKFSGATIISVAHRLDTIIDYDKILVLGGGKVLEFGTPLDLISKTEGHFLAMIRNTGDEMSETLLQRARAK